MQYIRIPDYLIVISTALKATPSKRNFFAYTVKSARSSLGRWAADNDGLRCSADHTSEKYDVSLALRCSARHSKMSASTKGRWSPSRNRGRVHLHDAQPGLIECFTITKTSRCLCVYEVGWYRSHTSHAM